ncbi:MAG: chitobiase/beta-hexosaminidase C-terminal domain-containing protein, partial [Eubacteriales bacterium]|nr:chitobiase/beta-hexosaminidase C-terminal domain-containing protein [Eubacteriales bacterium]
YGEVKEYFYQFGGTAMKAEVAPGTNEVMNDDDRIAFSTASGTTVTMSSADEDAKLLYVVSETYVTPARLTVSRVTGDISGLEDGASGRYFKIGNRWYETDKEAKVFQEGDLKLFNNDSDRNIEMYVGTVALVEDKEPSEQIIYGYEVQPAQQVSDPEAAIVTQSNPDGGNVASAVVEKGAYISFRSQTPGAELYYIIGSSDQVQDHEDETTGTKFYNDTTGILVDGDYGSQFYVSIKAVKRDEAGDKSMKDSRIICFIYTIAEQKQVLAPTATPSTQDDDPTVMTPGDKILLSSSTRGAAIYYTTDGSAPSAVMNEDGTVTVEGTTQLYDASEGILMPEEGEGYFTVRAIAVAEELKNSSEGKFVYAFPDPVQSPYATVPSGSVDLGQEIILKNRTDGATIYYTISTSGTEPADPTLSSSVFTEEQPIVISGRTVVKAIAMKNGAKSPVITLTYDTKDQLSPPEASIASGSMVPRGARLTLDAESGASVYYTIDGSDPSDASNSSAAMGRELILDGKAGDLVTVKAYARKEGKSASEVVTFTYQISQSAGGVTADVESGSSVSAGSKINLLTDVTGAEIYYTTDGTSPADHGVRGAVVTVSGTPGSVFTIKAVARVDGESGTVCTFTYKIKERPSAPTASPAGGVLTVATRVELSSPAEKIYYTTDGTTPTESSSLYKEAVLINRTTQLRAIAVSEDGEVSEVATFQYTAASRAGRPEASIADGSVVEPGTQVLLQTETSGAVIYYSTDGTEPTLDNLDQMLEYTEGITLNRTVTVKAAAYREDLQLSEVGTFSYVVETIPAVEQKKAEEARLEAEQLHATDASGLTRNTDGDDFDKERTLQEKDYHTTVSGTEEAIPEDTVLVTEKETYETRALENVRQLFGEEYTILDSYNMYLMRGGSIVQPDGQVEIGIPIPDRYENAAVTIVYIDGNNRITRQQTRREGGMAYAYTDHFSNYALVGLEEIGEGGFSIPYLLILEILAGLCALAGAIYFIRKKWKKNR